MKERIKELRKYLKLNQTDFGAAIGVTQKPVSDMEQGGNITERNFNAICKAFNVNPDWLREGVGAMFLETREAIIQSVVDEFKLTLSETALIRAFLELPSEYRQGVMEFARNIVQNLATVGDVNAEYPAQVEEIVPHKADNELTREERHAILDAELDAMEAAKKEASTLSKVSTGLNGMKRKYGKSP